MRKSCALEIALGVMEQRHPEHLFVTVKDGRDHFPSAKFWISWNQVRSVCMCSLSLSKNVFLKITLQWCFHKFRNGRVAFGIYQPSVVYANCHLWGREKKDENTLFLLVQYHWFSTGYNSQALIINEQSHAFIWDGAKPIITYFNHIGEWTSKKISYFEVPVGYQSFDPYLEVC